MSNGKIALLSGAAEVGAMVAMVAWAPDTDWAVPVWIAISIVLGLACG